MSASLRPRALPLSAVTMLTALVTFSLACSELGVDPGLPETDEAAAPAMEAAAPSASPAWFNMGLNETQQRSLFEVLAGTTDANQLDPAERDAMRGALAQSRARLVADFEGQAQAIQASGRTEEEQADLLAQQTAHRDFALAMLDRGLTALE